MGLSLDKCLKLTGRTYVFGKIWILSKIYNFIQKDHKMA